MRGAVVYVSDAGSRALAPTRLAGRSPVFRAVVAAVRAGAPVVGVPAALREPDLVRDLGRSRATAAAVRWLDGPESLAGAGLAGGPCLLLPASAVVDPEALRALSARAVGAALAGADVDAPVLLAPSQLVRALADRLAAGRPVGAELRRHVEETAAPLVTAGRPPIRIARASDVAGAEASLYGALGTESDTGVDRWLHRRCSLPITRRLVSTSITPNQVSLASLAVGAAAIACFWHATAASALLGILLYAAASVLDHCDGELARLTLQESRLGAHLDWAVDTLIHSGLALAMGVTAGSAPLLLIVGAAGAVGVALSALLARALPREIPVGKRVGNALRHIGNRDLFYLLLIAFAWLRWTSPPLLPALALLVAVGSHAYWIACRAEIHRARVADSRA